MDLGFSAKCQGTPRGFFVISFFAGPWSAKSSPTVSYWAKGCIFVRGGALHWLRCLVRFRLQRRIKPDLHYIEPLGGVYVQNVASAGWKSWGYDTLTMQVTFFAPYIVITFRGILEFAGHAQFNLRSMDWHAHWRARNCCWVFLISMGLQWSHLVWLNRGAKNVQKIQNFWIVFLSLSLSFSRYFRFQANFLLSPVSPAMSFSPSTSLTR